MPKYKKTMNQLLQNSWFTLMVNIIISFSSLAEIFENDVTINFIQKEIDIYNYFDNINHYSFIYFENNLTFTINDVKCLFDNDYIFYATIQKNNYTKKKCNNKHDRFIMLTDEYKVLLSLLIKYKKDFMLIPIDKFMFTKYILNDLYYNITYIPYENIEKSNNYINYSFIIKSIKLLVNILAFILSNIVFVILKCCIEYKNSNTTKIYSINDGEDL